jgi:hypothetical protein
MALLRVLTDSLRSDVEAGAAWYYARMTDPCGARGQNDCAKEAAMPTLTKATRSTVIPVLRYRNATPAIDWLCQVFGFEKQLVVPDDDGTILHAQLGFGKGMIT